MANEILDLASGQWQTGAAMPIGLNHLGVTTLNGRIYVFGGADLFGYGLEKFGPGSIKSNYSQKYLRQRGFC